MNWIQHIMSMLGLTSNFKTVSVQDLKAASHSSNLILDVRSPQEFASGHVQGAKNISVSELGSRLSEIPTDKTIFVICQSGMRSRTAIAILGDNGRTNINNVAGGTSAWIAAGFPTIKGKR